MALTQSFFKSFEQVEAHYNSIKPIRTRGDIFGPIVPIGDRRRKFERIIKLSKNCYVLDDGWHMGSPNYYYSDEKSYVKPKHLEYYAPVVWRRHKDGRVSVRIKNAVGGSSNPFMSRYSFLSRHLPEGMWLLIQNGKQYVVNESHTTTTVAGPRYYLAKGNTIPDFWKHTKDKNGNWTNKKMGRHYQYKDDKTDLVFWLSKHVSQSTNSKSVRGSTMHCPSKGEFIKWEWDGKSGKTEPKKYTKVNKEAKSVYKQDIKDFFDWGMTMVPLMPLHDEEYQRKYADTLTKAQERSGEVAHMHYASDYIAPKLFKKVLKSKQHSLRLAYWLRFASQCYEGWWNDRTFYIQNINSQETLTKVRRQYNNWVNTQAGFVTKGEK